MDLNNRVKMKSEDLSSFSLFIPSFLSQLPQARAIWAFVLIHMLIQLIAWEFSLQMTEVTLSQLSDSLWYTAVWKLNGGTTTFQGLGSGYLVSFVDWDLSIYFFFLFWLFLISFKVLCIRPETEKDFRNRYSNSNSMLDFNPRSCDKQRKSIQLVLSICIKCIDADRLFLWVDCFSVAVV